MQRIRHLRLFLLAFAAIWAISTVAPASLRICVQSSGRIQAGLTCPCTDCRPSTAVAGPVGDCCDISVPVVGRRCCTCIELPAFTGLALKKMPAPEQIQALAPAQYPPDWPGVALLPAGATWRTPVDPPPLLARTVVLRL